MRLGLILPAAGRGRRFAAGGGGDKLQLTLGGRDVGGERVGGRSVLLRSAAAFAGCKELACVVVAVPPSEVQAFELRWGDRLREPFLAAEVRVVAGGEAERWETVMRAMDALPADCTHIAVHDAARPLVTPTMIARCLAAAADHRAVIPAVRLTSTVKRVIEEHAEDGERRKDGAGIYRSVPEVLHAGPGEPVAPDRPNGLRRVVDTLDRRGLWAVQTPQVFDAELIRDAYRRVAEGTLPTSGVTDDASLVERIGGEAVVVVDGESTNLKITEPADAELADAIVALRESRQDAPDPLARLFDDDDE